MTPEIRKFKKILIANRGEIACRIIWTCKEMGIRTVAVHSDVDRDSLHVRFADEAACIGPAPSAQSYLNIPAIISAAEIFNVDAIHPGYGFLAESAYFAEICEACNIKFIGPRSDVIRLMGEKVEARRAMQAAGVPILPGSPEALQSEAEAIKVAREIGFPVIVKASAGGGGRGMRVVRSEKELGHALETASTGAAAAFKNGDVYLERFVERPRHIEIQVMADEHGNCVYLGERECSIQRRHQKLLEESPSAAMTSEMRAKMGTLAVQAARAAGYTNAGTIEFLADSSAKFYFLEMNTRLQVEHPVTELVTGYDLVQLQIRIAAGEKIPFTQDDVRMRGHAIECRIYAEDPENNYFPSPGEITALSEPAGPGIRVDSGIYQGWNVPIEYDPLLAKLIGWGENREQAIGRLKRALREYFIGGVKTNLALFQRILSDPEFVAGKTDTGYLARCPEISGQAQAGNDPELAAIATAIF